jgi:hypothetical protein
VTIRFGGKRGTIGGERVYGNRRMSRRNRYGGVGRKGVMGGIDGVIMESGMSNICRIGCIGVEGVSMVSVVGGEGGVVMGGGVGGEDVL